MATPTVYRKTAKGNEEIKAKKGALERRLRPLLILVDGHRSAEAIVELAAGIGIEPDALSRLAAAGYIESATVKREAPRPAPATIGSRAQLGATTLPAPTLTRPLPGAEPTPPRSRLERYRDGVQYMTETVSDALGVRALFFVLKIEKCGNALELLNLLPDFERTLAKKFGAQHAAHCRLIAAEILSE